MPEKYGREYYERGIENGISCYQNYHWMPEMTMTFCASIIEHLNISRKQKILDFGAGKGYMVKAFRLLHRKAFGVENSRYCLANLDSAVRQVIWDRVPQNMIFDWVISKDTFEHISYENIHRILTQMATISDNVFCIIPLAQDGEYRIPSYEMDKTHIIREDESWWTELFIGAGWTIRDFRYQIAGMKDNWTDYPKGNGFWTLKVGTEGTGQEAWRATTENTER